jgi:Fe-S cluster assembly protein SufD
MLQLVKEKANYLAAFTRLTERRSGKDPAWLTRLREDAAARFEELDFPTTRQEEWKYTNIAPLLKLPFRPAFEPDGLRITAECIGKRTFAETQQSRLVFINGRYSPQFSNLAAIPNGIVASNLADAPAAHVSVIREHLGAHADFRGEVFTALNTAFIGDGAFIYIPHGKISETPIHLLFISTASESSTVSHPRTLIVAGRGAMATVIESYLSLAEGTYFTNAVTEIIAGEGAVIDHYRLQEESERSFHIGTTQLLQERDSNYSSCSIHLGGGLVRHNLNARLDDENIECTLNGLYVTTGAQHIDNHTAIDHQRPHSTSRQLYKGILDGQSRAIFNGKVFVREGALLTDARQTNKNLLLSSEATVDTKPQLEIFADDVKCAHGATVGQLDDEELFYLASRGLKPEHARALLTYGFAEDVISKIRLASIRQHLDEAVLAKLHQSLEVR